MKLKSISCLGLDGYDNFTITDIQKVNVFTGPNGSGKSTALRIIKLCLDILALKKFNGRHPESDRWETFTLANLTFSIEPGDVPESFIPAINDEPFAVTIKLDNGNFIISDIKHYQLFEFHPLGTPSEIKDTETSIAKITESIQHLTHQYNNSNPNNRGHFQKELTNNNEQLEDAKSRLEQINTVAISSDGSQIIWPREKSEALLGEIRFPAAHFVNSEKAIEEFIPELIEGMCKLKSGPKADNREYLRLLSVLSHTLQHEVDFFDNAKSKSLTINGVDYKKASTGTHVSLAYFGITNLISETDIIIWDEPENGLHPTRRIRILDLIKKDLRSFFLATHALEFAPILYKDGAIFRCSSFYPEATLEYFNHPTLTITPLRSRGDAFTLLEALGVQPARTLFTASVVLWVEGPTELIFFRHWLNNYFLGSEIEEGFHYTIMHYGGGLISYLEANDDHQHVHQKALYDLLSLCRNPIVVVDSDIKIDIGTDNPIDHLKPAAKKILEQIDKINTERPDQALFIHTAGREIENYFPGDVLKFAMSKCWDGYKNYANILDAHPLEFGRYDSYHETIEKYLRQHGITEEKTQRNSTETIEIVPGTSRWGASNKVEMTTAALTYTGLNPDSLNWGFSGQLKQIANFIKKTADIAND